MVIQNYADDNEGYICPFYDGVHDTWEDLLRPYIYGDTVYYYRRSPDWRDYERTLFYCPKRYAEGQSGSNSGFYTNYTANVNVMSVTERPHPDPWNPNPSPNPQPWEIPRKFTDFEDHTNIAILFEGKAHVFGSLSILYQPELLDFIHYDKTHILMLNGTVRRIKYQKPLPVKLSDEIYAGTSL